MMQGTFRLTVPLDPLERPMDLAEALVTAAADVLSSGVLIRGWTTGKIRDEDGRVVGSWEIK